MVAVTVGLINEGQFLVVVSRLVGASVGSEGELGVGGRWCPVQGRREAAVTSHSVIRNEPVSMGPHMGCERKIEMPISLVDRIFVWRFAGVEEKALTCSVRIVSTDGREDQASYHFSYRPCCSQGRI